MTRNNSYGFTLVEILIVVVILGILAAVLIPQFSGASEESRFAATVDNLRQLRQQLDLYRNQHKGRLPGVSGASPDTVLVEQLTLPTNEAGDRSSNADQGFGDPKFPLGPYIPNRLPANPFNGSHSVKTVDVLPADAPGGAGIGSPGWIYDITSGRIKVNHDGTAQDGRTYWDL